MIMQLDVLLQDLLSQEQWKAWQAMVQQNSPLSRAAEATAKKMVCAAMKLLLWKGMNQWRSVVATEKLQAQMEKLMVKSVHRTMKHMLFKGWNQWRQVVESGGMDPMTDAKIYETWETVIMPACYTFCDPSGCFPEEVILVLQPVMCVSREKPVLL